jgi:hypothetical protein
MLIDPSTVTIIDCIDRYNHRPRLYNRKDHRAHWPHRSSIIASNATIIDYCIDRNIIDRNNHRFYRPHRSWIVSTATVDCIDRKDNQLHRPQRSSIVSIIDCIVRDQIINALLLTYLCCWRLAVFFILSLSSRIWYLQKYLYLLWAELPIDTYT